MKNLVSVLNVKLTSKSLQGYGRQPLPLGLEWLVRLAHKGQTVPIRQIFMKGNMGWGWVSVSARSICCTATLKAGPYEIQQSGFDWRKRSAVNVWVHLFGLHAAVVMFIWGVTRSADAVVLEQTLTLMPCLLLGLIKDVSNQGGISAYLLRFLSEAKYGRK